MVHLKVDYKICNIKNQFHKYSQWKGSVHKHDNSLFQENAFRLPLDTRGNNLQYSKVLGLKGT